MSSPLDYDVIVLGGGAAGLFCAFTAAQRGCNVLVLEKANKVGKKILMSGGGRCNFTNTVVEPRHFISANPHFCKSALKRYTQWDFIALVDRYEIAREERKHGQLFCLDSAKDILDMLLTECEQAGVQIRTRSNVLSVKASSADQSAEFTVLVEGQDGQQRLTSNAVVVATGALSIPTLGGSGVGYDIADQFGLQQEPRRAGLVPFMFSDRFKPVCERLSGIATEVTISCNRQQFTENMLFTHRGISGPAVLQISNYWHPGDAIDIDLLPDRDLNNELLDAKRKNGKQLLRTWLGQYLAKSLVSELQALFWPQNAELALAEFTDKQLEDIARTLHNWQLRPSATEGYRTAEVTLGGVSTHGISSRTMEANNQPGLYFIGEVLDVSGHLGGFNFQWAWSSAYAAGQAV